MSKKPDAAKAVKKPADAMTAGDEKDLADRVTKANSGRDPALYADDIDAAIDAGDGTPEGQPPMPVDDLDPQDAADDEHAPAPPSSFSDLPPVDQAERAKMQRWGKIVREAYGVFVRTEMPRLQRENIGSWDVAGSSALAGKYDLPDGIYRVDGYDWRLTFAKQRLVKIERCRPDMSGAGVISVSTQ